jgi:hypothetical protein
MNMYTAAMPESATNDDDVLARWKRKRLVAYAIALAAVLAGLASFTDSLSKIQTNIGAWFSRKPEVNSIKLPFDTGWILAGYYDPTTNRFSQGGPWVEIARTGYPDKQTLPRIGDWVRITGERNVIIPDYATTGLARQREVPLTDLTAGDYTGVKLPSGTTMEVRDVGGGAYPGRAEAVWLRVGAIPQ